MLCLNMDLFFKSELYVKGYKRDGVAFGKYTLWEILLFFQVHIRKRVGGSYRLT